MIIKKIELTAQNNLFILTVSLFLNLCFIKGINALPASNCLNFMITSDNKKICLGDAKFSQPKGITTEKKANNAEPIYDGYKFLGKDRLGKLYYIYEKNESVPSGIAWTLEVDSKSGENYRRHYLFNCVKQILGSTKEQNYEVPNQGTIGDAILTASCEKFWAEKNR
jgi:hypothetical protein